MHTTTTDHTDRFGRALTIGDVVLWYRRPHLVTKATVTALAADGRIVIAAGGLFDDEVSEYTVTGATLTAEATR